MENEHYGKVVFKGHASAKTGEPILTVSIWYGEKTHHIGSIYADYDPKAKTTVYRAQDRNGNELFPDATTLPDIKNKFRTGGKSLADFTIPTRELENEKDYGSIERDMQAERQRELEQIREAKTLTQERSNDRTITK